MNFLTQFAKLPTIQTRKALLLLDLQNDFLQPTGALHTPNTADFIESLPGLTSAFRRNGDVVWVRSHYKSHRPPIGHDAQELVILDLSRDTIRESEQEATPDEEAFLSTENPQCCRPESPGVRFPAPILSAIDSEADTVIDKSEYSALQNQSLILFLRTRFVTEIYLCGSLSNVSVYATALDSVRHGFAVSLIEDCLGFRSFPRHKEAMRRMADIFGASGITTQELYMELDWQETDAIAREGGLCTSRSDSPTGIEGAMDDLDFKRSREPPRRRGELGRVKSQDSRRTSHTLQSTSFDDKDDNSLLTHHTTAGPSHSLADNKLRVRARRSKRVDPKLESSSRSKHQRNGKSRQSPDCKDVNRVGREATRIVYDLGLPADVLENICREVICHHMYQTRGNVSRLLTMQGGDPPDGFVLLDCLQADETPLRPLATTGDCLRHILQTIFRLSLYQVPVQLYRVRENCGSKHPIRILDIIPRSPICNAGLDVEPVVTVRKKEKFSEDDDASRLIQRFPMPGESIFVLGEKLLVRIQPASEKNDWRCAYPVAHGDLMDWALSSS